MVMIHTVKATKEQWLNTKAIRSFLEGKSDLDEHEVASAAIRELYGNVKKDWFGNISEMSLWIATKHNFISQIISENVK